MVYRLGKKPYAPHKKDLLYRNYRGTSLPPIPASFGHQDLVNDWGMLGNDQYGDCVFAGADHETMLWTKEGTTEARFSTDNALSDYSAVTGFDPNDFSSDQGTDVREALNYRKNTGIVDSTGIRHKIGAFLSLRQDDLSEVLEAVYLFNAVGLGIQVPDFAQEQFDNGEPWEVVKDSNIEGGHYIPLVGYDGKYLYVITWGKVQKMSVDFFKMYCDEAWAILSEEFLNGKGVSPEGFDLAQLQQNLAMLTK